MKKKFLLLLPFFLAPSLLGCSSSTPTLLSYGTYTDTEARQLTSSEFSTRFESCENMLLAIYPKDSTCICWRTFGPIIDEVVNENHLLIYKYYAEDVDDNASMKRVGGFNNRKDAPTFYIIKNGKIAKYYNFSSSLDFFKKKDAFVEEIGKQTKVPRLFYINEEQADEKIKEDHSVIYFARYNCSDCNTTTPKILIPYFEKLDKEAHPLYVFDIESYKEKGTEVYQAIKDKYELSEKVSPTYGLYNGVVPTFHLYQKGILKDSCIVYNEEDLTYDASKDCYFATKAYYNEERNKNLHYLDNVEHKDFTKIEILEKDTYVSKEKRYWDNNASLPYYAEVLEGFMNTYLVK